MSTLYGLGWNTSFLSAEPFWTVEPDISAIETLCRSQLHIATQSPCVVTFLAEGAHNKVYKVEAVDKPYIMRIALPLDPKKVCAEVVTMNFVRGRTTIPVPTVIASDPTSDNDLKFPWILMEMAPGAPSRSGWRKMSMERKKKVIAQIADVQTQLARHSFSKIGGFSRLETDTDYHIARMVSDHYRLPGEATAATLGPHDNSSSWLRERLRQFLFRLDSLEGLPGSDPDERAFYANSVNRAYDGTDAMLAFLPGCYSTSSNETTTLFHTDLHLGNIFVDDNDQISAIIDWEFLAVVPEWRSHAFPFLLESEKRMRAPRREAYPEPEDWLNPDDLAAADGVSISYWSDLEQYECTLLRSFYVSEMDRLTPGWSDRYEGTKFHRLLEQEITCLERDILGGNVCGWVEAYKGDGKVPKGGGVSWPQATEDTLCWDELFEDEDPDAKGSGTDASSEGRSDCEPVAEGVLGHEAVGMAEGVRIGSGIAPIQFISSFLSFYFGMSD